MSYSRGVIAAVFVLACIASFSAIYYIIGDIWTILPYQISTPLTAGIACLLFYFVYDFMGDAP